MHLVSRQEIGHRVDHMAFNSALEMSRTVALVGTFLEKEIAASFGHAEKELAFGGFQDTLLNHGQFDVENLLQLGALKRVENHDLVQAIHEFG